VAAMPAWEQVVAHLSVPISLLAIADEVIE
jgi:hypothetical protein